MKICQISVRDQDFVVSTTNVAADVMAAYCFGAEVHYPRSVPIEVLRTYDAFFFTMWKIKQNDELRWMEKIHEVRKAYPDKLIILHQEAEADWWLTRVGIVLEHQKSIMELLRDKVDIFLAHDNRARNLNQMFMKRGKAYTWSTVQDLECIRQYIKKPETKTKNVGVNTFDGRANGVVGMGIASQLTKNIIQTNRSWWNDDRQQYIPNFFGVKPNPIPVSTWKAWLQNMTDIYVYLHPMPAASAGRDTITCAALGIPVIGNGNLDAQRRLFPLLVSDCFDVNYMKSLLSQLLNKEEAYNQCREYAMKEVEYHSIPKGVERAKFILEDYLSYE